MLYLHAVLLRHLHRLAIFGLTYAHSKSFSSFMILRVLHEGKLPQDFCPLHSASSTSVPSLARRMWSQPSSFPGAHSAFQGRRGRGQSSLNLVGSIGEGLPGETVFEHMHATLQTIQASACSITDIEMQCDGKEILLYHMFT
jgi:hypothetical protein